MALLIKSDRFRHAANVLGFWQNPNCFLLIMLFWWRKVSNRTLIIFSKTFVITDGIAIGLKSSTFTAFGTFGTGTTFEIFRTSGNWEATIELFISLTKIYDTKIKLIFISLGEILSHPLEEQDFRFFIIFSTSSFQCGC